MKGINLENGQKFGRWTVIDNNYKVIKGHRLVKCKCECGTEQWVPSSDLVKGRTKSCKHCVALDRRVTIPEGTKSKNWTITGETKVNKFRSILHKAQCDCGNYRWMSAYEFYNPTKAPQCINCAAKQRGKELQIKNGMVGELAINKYNKLQRTAETRNIEFLVSKEYLWSLYETQNKKCAITRDDIPKIEDASLDRIDSSKPYIEGNVQWVTKQANLSKHVMSMNELFVFCKKVLNHANQQPSQPLTKLEGSETNS